MKLPTNFNMKTIKNHKWVKKLEEIANTSVVAKIIVGIIIWTGVLIPTWLYLLIRWISSPIGFWQEALIVIVCMVIMGWLQVLLAVGGFMLTISLLVSDDF